MDYSQEGQLSHSTDKFAEGLSDVWKSVAKRCSPGARLIICYLPTSCDDGSSECLKLAIPVRFGMGTIGISKYARDRPNSLAA